MSDLNKLVKEIGFEVEQLWDHVEQEKNNITELQRKLLSLTQEAESQKKAKQQLEEELRSLESAYFQPNVHNDPSNLGERIKEQIQYLDSVSTEIESCNERFKKKRSDLLSECKLKLEEYDKHIAQNEKLRAFIELWKAKCGDNFRLDVIPDVIRQTVKDLSGFYETPLAQTIENMINVCTIENEEAQRSVTKLTPAESEGQGLELHKELKPNGTSCDGQLNLSIDLDAQIQGSNALDASRLRMSALDTSVMPALCRKESCKTDENVDNQDCTMNMDMTVCGNNDTTSY
uniref:Uncharacterized protein n=1 Tax=Trichobilharzia regenti TaxID=157069 RepID=A0AA85KBQ6_TRIRE|nr:unnamed protein product [Trichobilharzia regenti]